MPDVLGTFLPGDTAQADWAITPGSGGTTATGDITARIKGPDGVITTLSGITSPSTNNFQVIFTISSTAAPGTWTLRWESNLPSVVHSKEVGYTVAVTDFGADA